VPFDISIKHRKYTNKQLEKIGWATFWPIFSQKHLVTLATFKASVNSSSN
jgi:hypothetical protein